ncbi:MAG: hypothetical protein LW595_05525, partial [Rickettsiales bacterium]|nr:hypothetical protein [Rickettsiales bacterium]
NSLEECLLFDYVDKLRYEQYGLNDFYWALNKQNKKQANGANKNCKDYQGKEGNDIKINPEYKHEHQNLASNESLLAFNLTEINNSDIAEENPNFQQVKVSRDPRLLLIPNRISP